MGTSNGLRAISGAVLAAILVMPTTAIAVVPEGRADLTAFEVRTIYTSEFGFSRPAGITSTPNGELLVLDANAHRGRGLQLTRAGRSEGSIATGVITRPSTITLDATSDSITAIAGDRLLTVMDGGQTGRQRAQDPALRNAVDVAIDPASGAVYTLGNDRRSIERLDPVAGRSRITGNALNNGPVSAFAFNPGDGLLYLASRTTLTAIDGSGATQATYKMSGLDLASITDMTFAPSADPTDDVAINNLFVADAGSGARLGGVVEVSLIQPLALVATTEIATLIQMIDTSLWVPASPDPSGVTYLPAIDRFQVADSEVEEVTGAGYHGVNLWQVDRKGVVGDTGTLYPRISKEPTGLGSRSDTNVLFVSDDSAGRIHMLQTGPDGRFGTADDPVTFINVAAYGSTDPEDPEYHPASGHLFFVDGVGTEIYDIDPFDGVFGNGNDVVTHFDISAYGKDFEALASDPLTGTLIVGARTTKKLFEITTTGELVRTIDATGIAGLRFISGLTTAPSSDGSGRMTYWIVDRAVDNDSVRTENDGKMFEIAIPSSTPGTDGPPQVTIEQPAANATVAGTTAITATAVDDIAVTSVAFRIDGSTITTDTNGADGWNASWNSTAVADGSHTISVVATDTIGQTATASRTVLVDNIDDPPTVALTNPPGTVSGSYQITAAATDDRGLASVTFSIDGTDIGSDTNPADGWTLVWDTRTAPDGSHTMRARATDTGGQSTLSAPVGVTVTNALAAVDLAIATGANDVEERVSGGNMNSTSTDLDMMLDRTVALASLGLRFTNVPIPRGATITAATVKFRVDEVGSAATNLSVLIQNADNAPAFGTSKFNLTTRPTTGTSVAWAPPAWTRVGDSGAAQTTPNLSALVQQVVSRPGWASGNALVLFVRGSATGTRVADSFEGGAAPVLHIEWTMP